MTTPRNEVPGPYKLIMPLTVSKDLQRVRSARLAEAVMIFIRNELLHNPGGYKLPLSGSIKDAYAAKQRKFRVIYRIDEKVRTIEILKIQLR